MHARVTVLSSAPSTTNPPVARQKLFDVAPVRPSCCEAGAGRTGADEPHAWLWALAAPRGAGVADSASGGPGRRTQAVTPRPATREGCAVDSSAPRAAGAGQHGQRALGSAPARAGQMFPMRKRASLRQAPGRRHPLTKRTSVTRNAAPAAGGRGRRMRRSTRAWGRAAMHREWQRMLPAATGSAMRSTWGRPGARGGPPSELGQPQCDARRFGGEQDGGGCCEAQLAERAVKAVALRGASCCRLRAESGSPWPSASPPTASCCTSAAGGHAFPARVPIVAPPPEPGPGAEKGNRVGDERDSASPRALEARSRPLTPEPRVSPPVFGLQR